MNGGRPVADCAVGGKPGAGGAYRTPLEVRMACRENRLDGFASDALGGYLCVNTVMMHRDHANAFRDFCAANPVPCPLLGMLPAGETAYPAFAAGLDIRTDLRSYDLIEHGETKGSVKDVKERFTKDTVTFLVGSSVSLDGYLASKGMGPAWGPCIYLTGLEVKPVGPYRGPIAVTMRAYPTELGKKVAETSARFHWCHGAPLGMNNPKELGIAHEDAPYLPWKGGGRPDPGHDRYYWACGITPSLVARAAKLPLMIVHTPGNALITDIPTASLEGKELPKVG